MQTQPVGHLLKEWRQQRRVSQLELALRADVSARHISFLENGRSRPSRHMLLNLAEVLEVPLRDRNTLLVAAGYAPEYARTPLEDPSLTAARAAIDLVLTGHEPYPAIAVDRYWNIVAANQSVGLLLAEVSPELLEAPVNALRVTLHPHGLAPRIANLRGWRDHILVRLQRQVDATADPHLLSLYRELEAVQIEDSPDEVAQEFSDFAIPLRLNTENGVLSFITTTTVFGAVHDITLDELAIESFYPADEATARAFQPAED